MSKWEKKKKKRWSVLIKKKLVPQHIDIKSHMVITYTHEICVARLVKKSSMRLLAVDIFFQRWCIEKRFLAVGKLGECFLKIVMKNIFLKYFFKIVL